MDFSLNKNWLKENGMTCKISIFIQQYLNFKSHTNAEENSIKNFRRITCLSNNNKKIRRRKILNANLIGIILSTFILYLENTFIFEDNQLTKQKRRQIHETILYDASTNYRSQHFVS